jgi:hypothetical protein
MPINLFNNPLSSIKLGESNILKGYVGEGQLFPNNTEITAAAFTNSSITNSGGNTPYVVSGAIGSSFDLIGSLGATAPTGTQVLSTTSQTYQIGIGDQSSTCGATQRNSQIVITPQGNSVLASGLSNTDTISQAQGPQNSSNTTSVSCVVTNSSRVTVSSGGTLLWAPGASFNIRVDVSTQYRLSSITLTPYMGTPPGGWGVANQGFTPQAWNGGVSGGQQLLWSGSNASLAPGSMGGSVVYTIPSGGGNYSQFGAIVNIGISYASSGGCYTNTVTTSTGGVSP